MGIFQVGIFWVGTFRVGIFQGGVWCVGIFRVGVFLIPSKTCQDGMKISRNIEISFNSKHFFQKLEPFEKVTKASLSACNFFSIFSIFLFLLVLFKFVPLWIAIYQLRCRWLGFIFSIWLRVNSYFHRKKNYTIGKYSFVSCIWMFSLDTK